jgi:hypothetical protein
VRAVETEFFEYLYPDQIAFPRHQKESEHGGEHARQKRAQRDARNAHFETVNEHGVKRYIQEKAYYTRKHGVQTFALRAEKRRTGIEHRYKGERTCGYVKIDISVIQRFRAGRAEKQIDYLVIERQTQRHKPERNQQRNYDKLFRALVCVVGFSRAQKLRRYDRTAHAERGKQLYYEVCYLVYVRYRRKNVVARARLGVRSHKPVYHAQRHGERGLYDYGNNKHGKRLVRKQIVFSFSRNRISYPPCYKLTHCITLKRKSKAYNPTKNIYQ